ncbi:MAG: hypothetical protein F6J89_19980 [Symploca sp. SIO1C4]|uniref:Uncharacterized protein n=1 Tax=Symploca sp. SIO1C4 TaxID=2607765 RepID=A0A6B3NJQ0_9CYAN|nr:hypothetical protein [Symploca sp. SIO1C4]
MSNKSTEKPVMIRHEALAAEIGAGYLDSILESLGKEKREEYLLLEANEIRAVRGVMKKHRIETVELAIQKLTEEVSAANGGANGNGNKGTQTQKKCDSFSGE